MTILKAEAMGMCFGVRDALHSIDQIDEPKRATIYGELVHNDQVLLSLASRGFIVQPEGERTVPQDSSLVVITAHGISDSDRVRIAQEGNTIWDTTCPLVTKVHQAALSFHRENFHVLVVGKQRHVEVEGIVGDLENFDVIETADDVRKFQASRLAIVCQTTAAPDMVEEIVCKIRALNQHAEIRFHNTICQPTRDRQESWIRLLNHINVAVVVGGKNSNNTRQLVRRASEQGKRAFHIQSADDLNAEWFLPNDVVGMTAGTSTLSETIDEVHQRLMSIADSVAA